MKRILAVLTLAAALAGAWAFPGLFPGSVGSTAASLSNENDPLFTPSSQASLVAPMVLDVSGFISQNVETVDPDVGAGSATFNFQVATAGKYFLEGSNVNCVSDDANSFFVAVDTAPVTPTNIWYVRPVGLSTQEVTWIADITTPKIWDLTAGPHSVIVKGREAGSLLSGLRFVPQTTPVINSSLADTAANGSFYTYTIGALNFPTSWSNSSLPTGLSRTNSVISGTLASGTGSFSITLGAINDAGSDSETLDLTVTGTTVPDAPTVGAGNATGATSGTVAYTAPASNGGATITGYTAIGTPGGFQGTLAQAGSGTITVNGLTPSTDYAFSVKAQNVNGFSLASGTAGFTTSAVGTGGGAVLFAASASKADIETQIALAARGDTVRVPAGGSSGSPVVWDSRIILTKGIYLQGAGRDSTFVRCDDISISIEPDATAIANEEVIRVTGFDFNGNNAALNIIRIIGAGSSDDKPFKNLAIGHCRIRNARPQTGYSGAILVGAQGQGQVRGVIYANIFDRVNVLVKYMANNDSGQEWVNSAYVPFAYGSSDNLFFENNIIMWSSPNPVDGTNGWIETGQGARIVVRYNSYNYTNSDVALFGASDVWDVHGFQNWAPNGAGNGQTGTMITEFYGNSIANCGSAGWNAFRGSWMLMHNNIATGAGALVIKMMQYDVNEYAPDARPGSGQNAGLPLLPGSPGGGYISHQNNTYVWNNTQNGTVRNLVWQGGYTGISIQVLFENTHWWNYNASFDGSTGIGRGTSTPTMSATDGVAFWKNASPTPSVDPAVVQAGRLWIRRAGVWVEEYAPYTYPHPLAQ